MTNLDIAHRRLVNAAKLWMLDPNELHSSILKYFALQVMELEREDQLRALSQEP